MIFILISSGQAVRFSGRKKGFSYLEFLSKAFLISGVLIFEFFGFLLFPFILNSNL